MSKTFSISRGNCSQGPRWACTWPWQRGVARWARSKKKASKGDFGDLHTFTNQQVVVACSGSRSHPFGGGTSFHARRLADFGGLVHCLGDFMTPEDSTNSTNPDEKNAGHMEFGHRFRWFHPLMELMWRCGVDPTQQGTSWMHLRNKT